MSLILDHVSHVYGDDTALAVKALDDVSLEIPDGQFIGLIGHTGSGKSTLVQHLNGLIKATSGHIYFNGKDIDDDDFQKKSCGARWDWYSSTRSTSFLRQMFFGCLFWTENLGLTKKKRSCVLMRR